MLQTPQVHTQDPLAKLTALQEEFERSKADTEARLRRAQSEGVTVSANHPADLSDSGLDELRGSLSRTETRLKVVARATQKVQEGTYGRCDDCKGAIPEERLACKPEAIRCRPCQEKFDQRYVRSPKRH